MSSRRRIAVAADHAGRALRKATVEAVRAAGHEPVSVGPQTGDAIDYPEVAQSVAEALATGDAWRGIVLCGSGAGVAVAANKIAGVRAALAHETYTARQMVEHDHINVLAMGARVIGADVAAEVVAAFLAADFSGAERHARRLSQVLTIERERLMNAPKQLHATGQRLWLDNITKELIRSGTLSGYIDDLFVTGVTSNPTILEKAISGGADYDQAIASALVDGTTSPEDLAFAVALPDLVAAADLLRATYDASGGTDGYVSVEVSPDLADDAERTVAAGRQLFAQADRPNIMVKVPGTAAGLIAIEELIAAGISVNVTLLFSAHHYRAAAEAYLRGIERRSAAGLPLPVGSVASVFVSRWDVAVDPRLPEELHGKTALAVMQQIFAAYRDVLTSDRWNTVSAAGALPQKVLWASTGTKNPDLPDTYYVARLAAPGTVNTIPEATLFAFADHGAVGDLMEPDTNHADTVLAAVRDAGVDIEALATTLQNDGAEAFRASWADLLQCIERKATQVTPAR